eukprot:TRINITY_DN5130_c0_g2_i2.p1 TRINITY_DN5130_c0_g2~~TRINITY_DN5130_c0_g2_i2.p1  ORF type:complete len:106 (+),score=1.98 TRINITY_DN5130_c0_g2_i2:242-559(+)
MIDVFEIMITCASHIFKSWNFLYVDSLRLFTFFPEIEVVDIFLKSLTVVNRWRLTFPSFFLKIFPLRQIQRSSQSTIKILNNTKILLLNSRCNLENRTSSKFSIS